MKQLFSTSVIPAYMKRAPWISLSVLFGLFHTPVQGKEVTTAETPQFST